MSTLAAATERQPVDAPKAWASAVVPPVVAVAFALAIHLVGPLFGPYATRVLTDVAVAVVAAVSLNVVNGFTGQFSLGHAAFMALGGYAAAWATYYATLSRGVMPADVQASLLGSMQWLLAAGAVFGGLVAAAAGYVVGLPSLRLKGDYLAIVTLGFGEILRVLFQQTNGQLLSTDELRSAPWFGDGGLLLPPAVGGSLGFTDVPKLTNLFWAWLAVAITVLVAYRVKLSSTGRAMLSVREDEVAAEAMGVHVTRVKVRAFVLAAFFAGVAGALYAHQPGTTLRPVDAGFQRSIDVVLMVVLGGLGSISGAVVAAIAVTALNAVLLSLAQYGLLEYRMPLFALLLILTMIFRPQGLFGLREAWDFLPRGERSRPRGFAVVPPR